MNAEMKHTSLLGILDRDLARAHVKSVMEIYSPYLTELVNYATHVLARCEKSLKGITGTPASLIHLYYHAIQIADAIQVLTKNACFAATTPLYRSLWECTISIDHMLEDNFDTRSSAWMVESLLKRRKSREKFDPSTDSGKQFQEKLRTDKALGLDLIAGVNVTDIKAYIGAIDKLLSKPKFAVIAKKFRGKSRISRWFQIDTSYKSIEQVASGLNRAAEYDLIYRSHSEVAHARDSARMLDFATGTPSFTPIRPGESKWDDTMLSVCALLNMATLQLAQKLRNEEQEKISNDVFEIINRHLPRTKP